MFEYSNAQFFEQYSAIKHWVTKMHSKTVNPTAFILGGQPGAGKTVLQKQIRNNNKNIIIINADSFREFHPYFDEIQYMYGNESPKYTQPFINRVTERLIDELSAEKYNLIIEGTLRTANVPISSCKMLKEKGRIVSSLAISMLECHESAENLVDGHLTILVRYFCTSLPL